MWKYRAEIAVTSLVLALANQVQASGFFAPPRWLENGGIAADRSPEFFWALETKRLAKDFTPTEKRVPLVIPPFDPAKDPNATEPELTDLYSKQREDADVREFDEAIQKGLIKPTDVGLAKTLNRGDGDGTVPEFPSEFADYHRGADLFKSPDDDSAPSRAAWEGLLKRPKEERHYRSVWAAFMLGKAAMYQQKPDAPKWFQMTRELAKEGFADSLGLAADSYGWEAKSELDQGHYEAAAKLYLTQLALGDESAIVSLKALIPDREGIEGTMSFGEAPPENATEEQLKKWQEDRAPQMLKALDAAARGPYLRKLVTAHILATETVAESIYDMPEDASADQPKERCLRWLTTLEKAGVKEVDDADHLGWVAYTAGRYDEAARWLKMVKAETATSLWLDAKLKRRAGKIAEAEPIMAKALELVRAGTEKPQLVDEEGYAFFGPSLQPDQSAAGDLAALHVTRGDFLSAFSAFLGGRLWEDAAFIGDRVLTVDELKKYVDEHHATSTEKPKKDDDEYAPLDENTKIRWMLARRLVREDRYDDARPYFPAKILPILDAYVAALNAAANEKATKTERTRAWFTAAYLARFDGMELMGTEVEPDGFVTGGDFEPGSLDVERTEGARLAIEFDEKTNAEKTVKKPVKIYVPSTAEEKKRIAASKPGHNKRFHYRYIASVLTTKAAALMPDGSEELADVILSGASWIRRGDEKGADKLVETLFKRCGSTKIAKGLKSKQSVTGPWTAEESAARKKRNGIKDEPQQ
jgi:hypothetical protein